MELARGYIASGEFNGNRIPQHIQNQIIKSYCDAHNLGFVLSRAEYWINGGTDCQLWAALKGVSAYSFLQHLAASGQRKHEAKNINIVSSIE